MQPSTWLGKGGTRYRLRLLYISFISVIQCTARSLPPSILAGPTRSRLPLEQVIAESASRHIAQPDESRKKSLIAMYENSFHPSTRLIGSGDAGVDRLSLCSVGEVEVRLPAAAAAVAIAVAVAIVAFVADVATPEPLLQVPDLQGEVLVHRAQVSTDAAQLFRALWKIYGFKHNFN